jgi:class 3 adenylate cyclase
VALDLDALEAAGIADAHKRAPLLEYLAGLGITAEEMVEAEQQGRLFALAGDVHVRSGRPEFSLREGAAKVGITVEEISHAWAVMGLTVEDADQKILSHADLDAIATWTELCGLIGHEPMFGLLRVMGASLARLAEAESATIRAGVPAIQINYTTDELATARAYEAVARYVPRIGQLMDTAHRQHLAAARMHFEGVLQDASDTVVCGVGFVDLSDFTSLTQLLTPAELSGLLSEFAETVTDVVHADGGRVVKFIGDAVMWVSSTPVRLARAALDLVDHPRAVEAGLQVRAGLAFGPILAINGDYFGNAVNLAARLVATAQPGQILLSSELRALLADWDAEPLEPLQLKGFSAPQQAYALTHESAPPVE